METDQLSLRVNNASTVQTTDPKMESRVGDKVFTFARVMDEFASQVRHHAIILLNNNKTKSKTASDDNWWPFWEHVLSVLYCTR